MQVFINRAELASTRDSVRVLGYFDDGADIDPLAYGSQAVRLTLKPCSVENTALGPVLATGWRETNRAHMAEGESERRIREALPDLGLMALEFAILTARHGPGSWPREAHRRREEIEAVFAYVIAIRQAAKGAAATAPDPTADSHWPKRAG